MTIKTYKIKHENNYTEKLRQAKKVANYAIKNTDKLSTKYVKHFGLTSSISNQILRKYGRNRKIKKVSNVKLIIANYFIKLNKDKKEIYIPALKAKFNYQFENDFEKINQIEVDNDYFYVSVSIKDQEELQITDFIGIDRNTNGHSAVVACTKTQKVKMLGKAAKHIHTKYSKIRRHLQRLKKFKKMRELRNRESNKVKDLNHKVSREIVNYAKENNYGIKLEDLTGIRKCPTKSKKFKHTLNTWGYYQLQTFIEYKSKMLGIPVIYIDPHYTSKSCSKCGLI
jgi:putative transposase